MSDFKIEEHSFTSADIETLSGRGGVYENWPTVYILNNDKSIYVGETLNAVNRLKQHRASGTKDELDVMRILFDPSFNKSSCLDLESYLIKLFAGDGRYAVLNRNEGILNSDYYQRDEYRKTFEGIFDELRRHGMFEKSIPDIENSDLFKLSPFKALNFNQSRAVAHLLEQLSSEMAGGEKSTFVVQGDPGTGKTIIAIYLMKLIRDIQHYHPDDDIDNDTVFSHLFNEDLKRKLAGVRVGFVVPQQSLRKSIEKVFRKTPYLDHQTLLTPFQVGKTQIDYDLLIVDETHRLNQRASQSSAQLNKEFREINQTLFGRDDIEFTQLDWIRQKSRHQLLLLDPAQSVMPADLPGSLLEDLVAEARSSQRFISLHSQMRVKGGHDYINYVRSIFTDCPPKSADFTPYDFKLFDSFEQMAVALDQREESDELSRLISGYGWEWKTKGISAKKNPAAFDFEIEGLKVRWNSAEKDWVGSKAWMQSGSSVEEVFVREVGSIHTIQGYDLNYAGVIIGPDLRYDPERRRLYISREDYFDKRGKQNNKQRGIEYTDDDLQSFIINIYSVLMTRGIKGTYVYVWDEPLREYLRQYIPTAE